MASTVILKAVGLNTSPNRLNQDEGSLSEAVNIIIRRDGIIEQRRGVKLYGDSLPTSNQRVKQLLVYRDRILRQYSNSLQVDSDGAGTFVNYDGQVTETETGLRIKSVESNGNLYFTTSQGIKKLSAKSAATLADASIETSGAVKALDLEGTAIYEANNQTGFLPQDSAIAYRVEWLKKDNNNNRIDGAPSQRAVIYNALDNLVLQDFARVLNVLDNLENTSLTSARINDRNYVGTLLLPITASASTLRTNLIALAVKLDNDILYADQGTVAPLQISTIGLNSGIATITFSSGTVTDYFVSGSKIYLEGFNLATQSEIQTVAFSTTPTSGNFTLRYNDTDSASIAWNASLGTIQSTLRAVDGLQNVVVTGSITSGTGLTLTFPSTDGNVEQVNQGAVNTLSSGVAVSITVATTQTGISETSGSLNGAQTVIGVTGTTVTIITDAVGAPSTASATIKSNIFRSIEEPETPTIPATNQNLVALQDTLDSIILNLQELNSFIIASGVDSDAILSLDITTTATVRLNFTIPVEVAENSAYFYQIYRSNIAQAVGASVLDDISPNDELQLVYEDYPSPAELELGDITVLDVTPEDFRGENLYTNASTGEGIAQSNDQPPFAKDVARYRNSLFFANTRTKQRLSLNLLGVQKMIDDYDIGIVPKISITNGSVTNTYSFITGQQQIRRFTTVADVSDSLDGKYVTCNLPDEKVYFWFSTGAGAPDPAPTGYDTGYKVNIDTNDSAALVYSKFKDAAALNITKFIATSTLNANQVEITNVDVGYIASEGDVTTGFTYNQEQAGRGERLLPQISRLVACTGSDITSSGPADYFTINTAYDQRRYVVWFKFGTSVQPVVSGATLIQIDVSGSETNAELADKIVAALPVSQFIAINDGTQFIEITNKTLGECTAISSNVASGSFLYSTVQEGAVNILLSPLVSPARAVDATAKSIIRIINRNLGETVYAYYLSGAFDIPGKMLLESRSIDDVEPFYVTSNNDNTGASFNPIISPETTINDIRDGVSSVTITTDEPHGMENNDEVIIVGSDCHPIIDGLHMITYINANSFSIAAFVDTAGSAGSITRKTAALASENEEKANRVYYSKYLQPEAVPVVNYFDVGSQDKKILRIAPIRDSLFVFKEDGLFRISGDSAPFQLESFDNSYILLAPDSVAVANNVLYSWTTQGIQSLTEGGSYNISRNIDNIILKTQSSNYVNFKTATWGVGYESDNSYMVYTVDNREDTTAQIAYRYSTLTQSWTTYDKSNSCGVVNNFNDKLYLGATDVSFIEEERKQFDRTDYADREYETEIGSNSLLGNVITLPDITNVKIGDVFAQNQTLTVYEYNMLLKKLDMDTGVGTQDYFETLEMFTGDSPRDKLVALATKLDADTSVTTTTFLSKIEELDGEITNISAANSSVITSTAHGLITGRIVRIVNSDSSPVIDGEYPVTVLSVDTFSIPARVKIPGTTGTWETVNDDFEDIKTCYNEITTLLNEDLTLNFANYRPIDTYTLQEAIITNVNRVTRKITVNIELEFIVGAATIYKAITSRFTYAPCTFGDPLMLKQLSEATVMFETRTLTSASIAFATDLLPDFIPVNFNLDGNGIFGHSKFGEGFFGGTSNSAPFRTYVPRQCQRCRYIVVKYEHSTAREDYRILGITVSGNIGQSTRAFR